jgi:peroxiredoxin
MMKQIIVLLFILISSNALAQTTYSINGHFPNFPNSKYELKGYEGLHEKVLSTYNSMEDGKFDLTYPKAYQGIAQLWMNGAYTALLFLNQENFSIYWEDLTDRDGMQVTGSLEYEGFIKGMKTFQDAEAKLAGWNYLLPLYQSDSLKHKMVVNELEIVVDMFPNYVKSLPENLWVRHFLLAKGLVEQMPISLQTYNWRAPMHIEEFHGIDFKLHQNSGLIKEVIEGYTNLVEYFPLQEVYPIFEAAIDKVISELAYDPTTLQELTQQWFTIFESKSLFPSAEYLALKMLNQDNCTLDNKSTALFEQYRKLAIGKTAPNIRLVKNDLKGIKSNLKLVVFGASWCPSCQADYGKLKDHYATFKKEHDVEMLYISIDTDKTAFDTHFKDAPFKVFFDGKGWETEAAKAYHVFATPTYYLLDRDLKILVKINNFEHLEWWLKNRG